MLFGVIVGIALTVGVAYVLDSAQGAAGESLVNWNVVQRRLKALSASIQAGWSKLTNKTH